MRKNRPYNVAYVLALSKDGQEICHEVDLCDAGQERKECFVDATDVRWGYTDENGQRAERSEEEFYTLLTERGKIACEGKATETQIRIRPGGCYVYREDYDVGDLISVWDEKSGACGKYRVLGALEIEQAGNKELWLTVGAVISEGKEK